MASQHPHHLCLDLVGAQCLTSFCSDTVGSLWRRKRKTGRRWLVTIPCVLQGWSLTTEVLGKCSVSRATVKTIVQCFISL